MYEIQITHVVLDKKGNDKTRKENLILENIDTFAQAEECGYEYSQGLSLTDADVVAIKRSKLKEIVNERQSNDDLIWIAELQDVFLTDEGEEKTIKYKMALFAKTFSSAKSIMSEYIKQGYNMVLIGIKLSKFNEVLR